MSPSTTGNDTGDPLTPEAIDEMSYEDAMEAVESIIERIEAGEIGLEDALGQYEQGVALLRRCRAILKRVDQRVTELAARDLDGGDEPSDDIEDAPF